MTHFFFSADIELLKKIKLPPKMLKRVRPKGANLTIIGLPSQKRKKKENNAIRPKIFANQPPKFKEECK